MRHDATRHSTTPAAGVSSARVARETVSLKSGEEIEAMRRAGAVASRALRAGLVACHIGATTRDVAAVVGAVIDVAGARAIFRGYRMDGAPPFGAPACVSVNEEIVHGLPGDRSLATGDVVSVDVGVSLDGWCADTAGSVVVGPAGDGEKALVRAGGAALDAMLRLVHPGERWSVISAAGERVAQEAGCLALRGWAGHGVGRRLHEAPALPMCPRIEAGEDVILEEGMTLAIEPLVALAPTGAAAGAYADGSRLLRSAVREDGWTVVSLDGWLTCHFEHTVAVGSDGPVLLTAA